jgi:glutathione-regulated potassium-efflux system ancillary protein KefG
MKKILILFAHPRFEQSRTQKALVKAIPDSEHITFHDLYELYPDFNIDVNAEKKLLEQHDIIIWQHPFYWYSCPPLLKQWIDMVLEFGWAYGPNGTALKGKIVFNTISSGGTGEAYLPGGRNRFTISEYLRPFEQTVKLCNMTWLPAYVVHGTHKLNETALTEMANSYGQLLSDLINDRVDLEKAAKGEYLNDKIKNL